MYANQYARSNRIISRERPAGRTVRHGPHSGACLDPSVHPSFHPPAPKQKLNIQKHNNLFIPLYVFVSFQSHCKCDLVNQNATNTSTIHVRPLPLLAACLIALRVRHQYVKPPIPSILPLIAPPSKHCFPAWPQSHPQIGPRQPATCPSPRPSLRRAWHCI